MFGRLVGCCLFFVFVCILEKERERKMKMNLLQKDYFNNSLNLTHHVPHTTPILFYPIPRHVPCPYRREQNWQKRQLVQKSSLFSSDNSRRWRQIQACLPKIRALLATTAAHTVARKPRHKAPPHVDARGNKKWDGTREWKREEEREELGGSGRAEGGKARGHQN